MLRLVVGIAIGFIGGYLYGSQRARDEARRRLAKAPEPVRQATERISGVIAGAPLPDAVKQAATRATAAFQTATDQASVTVQAATEQMAAGPDVARPSAAEVASRPMEPLPRYEPESRT